MNKEDLAYWIKAMEQIAIDAHKDQTRNDGKTPYMKHVYGVANAVEDKLKPIALGHDLVEDTPITIEE